MKNDFVKNKNNVVISKNNGSFINIIAVWLIIIVSACSVLGCVFSALNYFRSDINTASADFVSENALYESDYFSLHGAVTEESAFGLVFDTSRTHGVPYVPVGGMGWNNNYDYSLNSVSFKITKDFAPVGYKQFRLDIRGNRGTGEELYFINPVNDFYNNFIEWRVIDEDTGSSSFQYYSFRQSATETITIPIGNFNSVNSGVYYLVSTSGDTSYINPVGGAINSAFNCSVVKVKSMVFKLDYEHYPDCYVVCFTFIDNNNKEFVFYYTTSLSPRSASTFIAINTFTYYTEYGKSFYTDANYNLGYSNGYDSGYNKGYNNGETVGDINGYNRGYESGRVAGYNAGVNDTHQYTFFNLISAVIDAPIQAFVGLFNFDLLGVNLFSFFTGLLTLALIIFIIRLILGG